MYQITIVNTLDHVLLLCTEELLPSGTSQPKLIFPNATLRHTTDTKYADIYIYDPTLKLIHKTSLETTPQEGHIVVAQLLDNDIFCDDYFVDDE